jgi:Family of unknown function (DUF6502)
MNAAALKFIDRDRHGQALLDDVVRLFTDLLIASGATLTMIDVAMSKAVAGSNERQSTTTFTELGALLRDCMEVMCAWRRDVALVGNDGEPTPLEVSAGKKSFEALCSNVGCKHPPSEILKVLLDFGAVSISADGRVVSETPTFLLGRAASGGRLATDGLLKQLEGYLHAVHHNVCSVSGKGKPKFERACTVAVAIELEPIFDRLVRTRGQEFIDSIDEWLERNAKHESASGTYVELGAGAYFVDLGVRPARPNKC